MKTSLRILLLFIPELLIGQWTSRQVHRADHIYLWQGREHLLEKDWLDAIDFISVHVPFEDTSYFKSLIYLANKKLIQTNLAIKEHAEVASHHFPYETKIILGLANTRIYSKARGYFNEAIELDPSRVEGYLEKVKIFSDQENYLAGIDHANRAIRLFPDKLELYVLRGNLYVSEGLRKRAFRDFTKAVDAEGPLDDYFLAPTYRGLAWSYLRTNEVAKAEIYLQESLVIEPNHPFTSGLLAEIKFLKGDAQGAIDAYETITRTENREGYYLLIGLAHEELKEIQEACKFFKACCDRDIPMGCKKIKALNCGE